MLDIVLINLASLFALTAILWVYSLIRRDSSIIDPFWGLGFVIVAWLTAANLDVTAPRSQLMVALVSLWGLRLSAYLIWRNFGKGEDFRYVQMRRHHGRRFWYVSLFTVFWLQACLLGFVSLPIQFAIGQSPASRLGWVDLLGVVLWLVGIIFESVGDFQLASFKSKPANQGRVMDRGLWRYTRHPNYFGDFCVWWGLYLVAVAAGAGWTIASPILMSFLLIRVSGVRLLEQTIADRRPGYVDYMRRTNAFFPGPPRREA